MTRSLRSSLVLCAALALALSTFERPDMPKTNTSLDLFYSSQWNTAPVYTRNPITATWGLKSEGGGLPPASASATLDNRDGSYVPTDARSDLFGLIGRNTPARVALTPGLTTGTWADTADTFTRTSVNSWGSATSGQAWSTHSVGGTIAASDFQVASGVGSQSVPAANAYRLTYMAGIDVTDVAMAVTMTAPQAATSALEIGTIVFRGTSTAHFQQVRVLATTSNTIQLRAVATDGSSLGLVTVAGLTHAGVGTPLRVRVSVHGQVISARVWDPAGAEPTTWHLSVVNTVDVVESGWIGVRSARALGNTNTSPTVFKFDNWESTTQVPLVNGGVSSWDPDRAIKGDAWTGIEINGPATRINADRGVRSALTRTLSAATAADSTGTAPPDAWWPMEGQDLTAHTPGTGAVNTAIPPLLPSAFSSIYFPADPVGPITTYTGPEVTGTASLVDLGAGSQLIATPPYSPTATSYAIEISMRGKAAGASPSLGFQALKFVFDNGSTITGVGASTALELSTGNGAPVAHVESLSGLATANSGVPFYNDRMRDYRIEISQQGANVQMSLFIDGTSVGAAILTTATMGSLRQVILNYPSGKGESVPQYGQLRIWNTASWAQEYYQAANGYPRETAADRFARVCEEARITAGVVGSDSAEMGPQYPGTLTDILDEIARTDNGLIYDALTYNGLEMRTGRSRYNQTPALELTFGVDVAPPLKPSTGDLGLTNSVTANRPSGGTAVAQQTSGDLNINDPFVDPQGIGLVPTTLDVNPETDDGLPNLAAWTLHTGTWPGARYENVTVDLTAHPELYQAALSVRPGDLITIEDLEADLVELQVIGGQYVAENNHLRVTFNCVPGGPYRILQVETSGYMRIGSGTSSLAADFNAGAAVSMSVAVTGALWSTTAPPFHIMVGGVVLNVTAISGASSPQTFTVSATPVNGVTKLLSASAASHLTRVDVYPPIFIGL
jgi:hypothetical protein